MAAKPISNCCATRRICDALKTSPFSSGLDKARFFLLLHQQMEWDRETCHFVCLMPEAMKIDLA